jgi:hypothetical protein
MEHAQDSRGLDPVVATLIDSHDHHSDSEDSDALIASLEEGTESGDPTLAALRESRLEQLRGELLRSKQTREQGSGSYDQLKDEKAVMEVTTGNKLAVVHFHKPEFQRCKVMGSHLEVGFLDLAANG